MSWVQWFRCDLCEDGIEITAEGPSSIKTPTSTIKGKTGIFCEACKLDIERKWIKEIVLEAISKYHEPRAKPRLRIPHC